MLRNKPIIMHGVVEYVEGDDDDYKTSDDAHGARIKVRLDGDGNTSFKDLDYAFPLLPKTIQSPPKVGEGVFVLSSKLGNHDSQRFYIGPIISQPQDMENAPYTSGRGKAMSLLSDAKWPKMNPYASIDQAKQLTRGAFPSMQDVALLGRGQEDVVLKYRNESSSGKTSEVDIRAGIRVEPSDNSIKYLRGNVVFNTDAPAYIQVKHSPNGLCGLNDSVYDDIASKYESTGVRTGKSVINLVADKVNIISHKDTASFGSSIKDQTDLIKPEKLDEIMSQLHRSVYGDELVTLLKLIVDVIKTHTHPYSMLPPTVDGTSLKDLVDYKYENILSSNVRIS